MGTTSRFAPAEPMAWSQSWFPQPVANFRAASTQWRWRGPSTELRTSFPVMERWGRFEQEFAMCDYSLHGVPSRPASVGDRLVTRQFWNTTTRGFAAVNDPNVA